MPCHIFGNRGLPNVDAELEEFSMNPGSASQRVGEAHFPVNWKFRAAPSVCRRDVATSIARTSETQRDANG